jgi:hypothetical protein
VDKTVDKGAEVSLSGNLGFVPLDEVLRLLRRSDQHGCVDVRGSGIHGRVFMGGGGIDIATTYDDEDLLRHLVNSGFTEESILHRISTGETTLAAVAEANQAIVDLIREMSVESLYQMSVHGDEFYVDEGASTQYASPKSFELEALLRDATERSKEWAKVTEVITDLNRPIGFRRDLGEREEVTVKGDDWMVLSHIGPGASVSEIAEGLGTTEFWTARVAARLAKSDLIEIARTEAEPTEGGTGAVFPEPDSKPERSERPEVDDAVAAEHSVVSEADPNESWWKAPEDDEATFQPAPAEVERAEQEDADNEPAPSADLDESQPVAAEPALEEEDPTDVEEDTETFLEKVFSELESSESEPDEGHGLLRRRRMGTLRDFSSDS